MVDWKYKPRGKEPKMKINITADWAQDAIREKGHTYTPHLTKIDGEPMDYLIEGVREIVFDGMDIVEVTVWIGAFMVAMNLDPETPVQITFDQA